MLQALKALVVSNYNQQSAMERAVVAKAQGLDPETYARVYPGSTVTTNTTTNNTGNGLLKGAILSAAMLAAGGAGTYGVVQSVAPTPPTTPNSTVKIAPADKPGAWDAITEEMQPDGTWKQIKRERLK